LKFYCIDLLDKHGVCEVFSQHPEIYVVFHLAALKSVSESHQFPDRYWVNNVDSSAVLFSCMERYGIFNVVFSSSACVYGTPVNIPIPECSALQPTNPYGASKLAIEQQLSHLVQKPSSSWRVVILRYFNPIGAHPSGLIGEDPCYDCPNLLPIISQVALNKRDKLLVFGQDYNSVDGTTVRDYIHIMDLVKGHIAAVIKFSSSSAPNGLWIYNLGTGKGHTVLQVIKAFEKASNRIIPWVMAERRKGDAPVLIADPTKAKEELNWVATESLDQMCGDLWYWLSASSNGYNTGSNKSNF